jgi:hypothetical protein
VTEKQENAYSTDEDKEQTSLKKMHVEEKRLNEFLIKSLVYAAILDSSRGVTLTPSGTVLSGPYLKKRSVHLE